MADKDNKFDQNVKGVFYVDRECIDCDACQRSAPKNFTRDEDGCFAFVDKQPENDEEYQECIEAMEMCPVDAIGDDGDE